MRYVTGKDEKVADIDGKTRLQRGLGLLPMPQVITRRTSPMICCRLRKFLTKTCNTARYSGPN